MKFRPRTKLNHNICLISTKKRKIKLNQDEVNKNHNGCMIKEQTHYLNTHDL